MSLISILSTALKALLRNPTRAMLTTLGIVIGIAAVITMMEIGTGSSNSIRESIEKMGANAVMVIPGADRRGGVSKGSGSQMSLTPEDCEAINRECPAVAVAVPVVSFQPGQTQARRGPRENDHVVLVHADHVRALGLERADHFECRIGARFCCPPSLPTR